MNLIREGFTSEDIEYLRELLNARFQRHDRQPQSTSSKPKQCQDDDGLRIILEQRLKNSQFEYGKEKLTLTTRKPVNSKDKPASELGSAFPFLPGPALVELVSKSPATMQSRSLIATFYELMVDPVLYKASQEIFTT
jgi:hypothetical protein